MKISGDMAVKLALGVLAVAGVVYVGWRIKNAGGALMQFVPQVVKDGVDAGGQLLGLGYSMVTNPFDTFGIEPNDQNGPATWEKTVPWSNQIPPGSPALSSDPVSNNSGGVNYNYF